MSKIIEAKAVISAADKTGSVFDKIAAKIKGVEKSAKAFENLKGPQKFVGDFGAALDKLKASEREMQQIRKSWQSFDQALKSGGPMRASKYLDAMDMWKSKTLATLREVKAGYSDADRHQDRFFRKAGRFALAAGGVGGGAYVANRVGRAGITAAATGQRESARDYLAGLSDADSARLAKSAASSSSRYNSVDASTMHEHLRDTSMGMRSVDKALSLSDDLAQASVVAQSLRGKEKALDELRQFMAGLDVLGKNNSPEEVRGLLRSVLKAMAVEGKDMNMGGFLNFAKTSKAAGGVLSDRFLGTTGPSLMRDMGDHQLGTSLASSLNQNVGAGRATKQAKAFQTANGLRGKDGRFLYSDEMMHDPDLYAWNRLDPAMRKAGVDMADPMKVTEFLAKAFSAQTVQNVFGKLLNQGAQYQEKTKLYQKAPDLPDAAKQLGTTDPFVAYEGIFAQMRNLATQAPLMDAAAAGLAKLSAGIGAFNEKFAEAGTREKLSMGVAAGIGGGAVLGGGALAMRAAYQWFTGGAGALNQSAALLDKAALELTAAAVKLASPSKIPGVPTSPAATTAASAAGGSVWGAAGARALAFAPGVVLAGGLAGGLYAMHQSVSDAGYVGMTSGERLRKQRGGSMRDVLRRQWGYDKPGEGMGPEGGPTATGAGGGGPVTATLTGSAEVSGEATVKVEVTVNPSSELITATANAKASAAQLKGMLNANGPGSTGRSSPDAAAPSPKGNTGSGGAP